MRARKCSVCKKDKVWTEFSKRAMMCKKCRADQARKKYAERKEKNLCPVCGQYPSMVSSCMCESCWFIKGGKARVIWIEQGKECPYTKTPLVPGHNMRFVRNQRVSKRYAVASKGMKHERFKEWCKVIANE